MFQTQSPPFEALQANRVLKRIGSGSAMTRFMPGHQVRPRDAPAHSSKPGAGQGKGVSVASGVQQRKTRYSSGLWSHFRSGALNMNKRKFGALVLASMASAPALRFAPASAQDAVDTTAMAKKLMEAVPPHGERSIGDPKAPVTMIEYASASCPHCAEFHMQIWPGLKKDYVDTGKVRFILREFPTDQSALGAFMLARCLPEDKYYEAIDMMFLQQKFWRPNPKVELFRIVSELGLSEEKAEACIKQPELAKNIVAVRESAIKDFGIKGTPSFFINGKFIDGHEDPAAARAVIDAALAAVKP
jgi:protein-disulfide isomerase